jgi:hypothetical protein
MRLSRGYVVTFEGRRFETTAVSEDAALSFASKKLADEMGEPVALVRWKINKGEIGYRVKESDTIRRGK